NGQPNVIYSIAPGTISVTLSGPIPVLSHLGPEDVSATVDVKNLSAGTQSLPITIKVPPLLKQEGVQPTSVSVTAKSENPMPTAVAG
ncbi:MAG: hypothetical protein IT339_05845, partial [Thermomicrobiales bacterium]|nr:hypothetical protein [Thermomicrobiales bacterium]